MKVLRRLKQNWKWFIINIIGLSTALTCLLVIFRFVRHEVSYDRFHSKADRIYRLTTDTNRGAVSIHPARVYGDWPVQLMAEYPSVEKTVRLVPYRNAIVRIDDQKFYSQNAFMTDSSFFNVFDFKVLAGDRGKAFTRPGTAFISRSLAEKYFGHTDVIGMEITILHQQDPNPKVCFIEGVMEDFPVNSHFHAEVLTSSSSFSNLGDRTTWAYTYYLLKRGTDPEALRKTIQEKWEAENETDEPTRILHLQKLTDIHLFSQKTREIEMNGNVRSVILLMTGGVIILIIALVNFLNQSALKLLGITNPGEAVGKRFRINFFLPDLFAEGEITGVVPDFHYTNLHNEERPLVIVPRKMFNYNFIIGISPEYPGRAMAAVDEAWGKINPEFPFRYQFITDIYQDVYRVEYAQTRVLSLFALISVILSALGIFALAAFTIQKRVKEIGIRKVNGAQISEILLLLNRDFIRWIAVAFLIAIPVAWIVMHKWLENFAYKTELNWWIFVLAGTLAMGVALLTVSWQSWRAATRNPVEALRYE